MQTVLRLISVGILIFLMMPQHVQAGGDKGKDPYELGEKYFGREDYRRALQHYRKALGQNDVRAHYRMGLIYEDSGRDRDAIRHYRSYMDKLPKWSLFRI